MTRVLLTGATGFVGSRLVRLLVDAGHEVHVVARASASVPGTEVHVADLLEDARGLADDVRPEVLVHLAWSTEHGAFWTDPENVDWVAASLELLRSFVASGGRRAVVAGTCAEYDWTRGSDALREDSPLAPATLYGAAKAALFGVSSAFAAQQEIELAWGRIFFPYGAGEAPGRLVTSVAASLLRGEVAETTSGDQLRDFIHVDDVAAAFAALVDSPVVGAVNIGTGDAVRVRDVVELTAAAAGRPELLSVGARPMRDGDPPAVVADVRRLVDELGFRPRVSLADGLAATVDSLRSG